jgi:hypothetical protein
MKVSKILTLFVLASIFLAVVPAAKASTAIALSTSQGYCEDTITVSGTIDTYNGQYYIIFDAARDGTNPTFAGGVLTVDADDLVKGPYTATGYAYAKDVKIPLAYAGACKIWVFDVTAGPPQLSAAFFTVQTKWNLKVDVSSNVEGGPFVFNATVTGWGDAVSAGTLDMRIRTKDVDGNTYYSPKDLNRAATVGKPGFYQWITYTIGPLNTSYIKWGTYNAYVDWDDNAGVGVGFDHTAQNGVATTTFDVRMTNKASYGRTATANLRAYVTAPATANQWKITDPTGIITTINIGATSGAFTGVSTYITAKNSPLGAYTVQLLDTVTGTVYKTTTFSATPAAFTVTWTDFTDPDGAYAAVVNEDTQRTQTSTAKFRLSYPDASLATSVDIPTGFTVGVYYNKTLVTTINLDPLTTFEVATNKWVAAWKIPKNQLVGKGYSLNVTASGVTDQYGNVGPSKFASTAKTIIYFKVSKAVLAVTAPSLVYPITGANLQRTIEARASFQVTYPDGTKVGAADFAKANATTGVTAVVKVPLSAADYSSDAGLWIAKWESSYKALLGPYTFNVVKNEFVDAYGNKGPAADTAASTAFNVIKATIEVSDVAIDNSNVQTDEQITVSFKATYPNGDPVTTRSDLGVNPPAGLEYPVVTIYNDAGGVVANLRASYTSGSQKWTVSWIVPTGSTSGTYNATVDVYDGTLGSENGFADNADTVVLANCNSGPTAKKYVNFDVSRVSMVEVLAASNAAKTAADAATAAATTAGTTATSAKTAADLATVAANAAKTAADAAKTAADAAKTAATSAQTTAQSAVTAATDAKTAATSAQTTAQSAVTAATDAKTAATDAKTAANAAKTSADAAKAATDSLTTMVYVAIAASVVAALAAIFAVMQITKKIA